VVWFVEWVVWFVEPGGSTLSLTQFAER